MGAAATPRKQAITAYLTKSVCRMGTAAIFSVLCTRKRFLEACANAWAKTVQSRRKSPPPCNDLESVLRRKSDDLLHAKNLPGGAQKGEKIARHK